MAEIWDRTHKEWIKNLRVFYKQNDNIWNRVSEMVGLGLFNPDMSPITEDGRLRESLPVGADCTLSPLLPTSQAAPAAQPSSEQQLSVKRVVCSPDLPVFSITPTTEEQAVDSSTSVPEKVFQCSFCNKTFNQKNTFQNHLRSHGKEGEDPYQCNFCGKSFAVPARLTRHYRTHTGEKPYQCEYCKKSFSVKENLSVHRRIHTKERPYKCDICERAFEHSGKLHRHMRIHTGERPHKCGICSKTFIQSGQLVIHMRTHTGEKPYVCKSCGKGFTCSKQLKVHNRTHTGEKPYACEICGKSFGYNHVLKLHLVAHYGEKVYKCTICNETFTSKKSMESHIKSHSESSVDVRGEDDVMSPGMAESSCASSTSDKENNKEVEVNSTKIHVMTPRSGEPSSSQPHPNMRELVQYLYPRSSQQPQGLNPALLAAAAAEYEGRQVSNWSEDRPNNSGMIHVIESSSLPVTEPPVYLIPDTLASIHRRQQYSFNLPPPPEYLENQVVIDLQDDKMREEEIRVMGDLSHRESNEPLTPPSSNPVSPSPSSSPDPLDLAILPRDELTLPPRKRKINFKPVDNTEPAAKEVAVRHSSVIHFARAS
ncbi:Krueppel homolog 1-like [Macrosteles quadrilineatus]|uniref:Krueppel homolog 1-like n=1 Tax=Macrosteles quadrilineatus TaxID=74068 RepID=UPI0023E0AD41|nr:Krueppel homolog 1-like [Macrosteles quadrilineatus]